MRVGVIGAGTAGSACALFMARAGHDVTVFERVPEPRPVGAGIMMQPSGLLVLERLGLAAPILARGARVDRLRSVTADGTVVLDLAYEDLAPGLFGVGLHRGVLFETLLGAVRTSQARLRCGVSVARVSAAPGGRAYLVDDTGERHGPFDLVAVCDGSRSHVRDAMPAVSKRVTPYPWGALWYIGKDPRQEHAGALRQTVRGARQMIGVLPTGIGPQSHSEVPLVSLFYSVRADTVEELTRRGIAAWKREVSDLVPSAEGVLAQIDDFRALTFASYYDVVLPRWHEGRVVFLGDAAHATSPQLGQGCNLALCDAAALADALVEGGSVEDALARYTAARREHLAYYQLATRWLTPFFQSDIDFAGTLRDVLFPVVSRVPFVRREMVRSMAGTKTGILWGTRETRMPTHLPGAAEPGLGDAQKDITLSA